MADRPGPRPRKARLDDRLVALGLADNRSRARALIMAGKVRVGDRRVDKPGTPVASDADIRLDTPDHPWASRGGLKLVGALNHFALDVSGCVALDLGASTGGFTDVLLSRGVAHVHAVDVGYGQLHWRLRQDARVTVHDRTNVRHLTLEQLGQGPMVITADLSFIGLEVALPAALALAAPGALLIALIKPQFEVGPGLVGKGGIVRDSALHAAVTARIATWLERQMGWQVLGIADSPVTGADGNREFLVAARRPAESAGA